MTPGTRALLALAICAAITTAAAPARADYPDKPIRVLVPFPAGGTVDLVARLVTARLAADIGGSFVIENKGGAGGVLGADAITKSQPDGYTVGLGGIASNVLAIGNYAKLPYDPVRDFTFISGMWQLPNILTARKDFFSQDVKELFAAFKKEPRKYTYASAGFGTTLHLSGEMMNSMAGVEVMHVPYKGAGPALNDLLGGRVDMLFDNLPGSLPSVKAGLIRPIAVTAKKRLPELPDVPAMAEFLPGYEMTSWACMVGPAGIRGDVIERANALTVTALKDDFVKKRYADLGATVWPTTPDECRAYRDSEEKRLLPIIKAAGIKPE